VPRLSREAVAAREKLAREMFQAGKKPYEVQKAMEEFDVGGGKKGFKMAPPRLAEIEAEVKGGSNARVLDSVSLSREPVRANVSNRDMARRGELEEESAPEQEREEGLSQAPAQGMSVRRCVLTHKYKELDEPGTRTVALEGEFIGEDAGLFCFKMEDGRVWKKWANERVVEVT
jgi:hypothetical protein